MQPSDPKLGLLFLPSNPLSANPWGPYRPFNENCILRKVLYFCILILFQKNTGQADGQAGLDLNVEAAWAKGYTGKGVTIAIMDDGKKTKPSPCNANVDAVLV